MPGYSEYRNRGILGETMLLLPAHGEEEDILSGCCI